MGLSIAALGWLSGQTWFYGAFGVQPGMAAPNDALSLLLFMLIVPVFGFFVSPLFAGLWQWLGARRTGDDLLRLPGDLLQLDRFRRREAQRLLADDMLSSRQRCQCLRMMMTIRRGDMHHIHLPGRQHGFIIIIPEDMRDAPLLRRFRRAVVPCPC